MKAKLLLLLMLVSTYFSYAGNYIPMLKKGNIWTYQSRHETGSWVTDWNYNSFKVSNKDTVINNNKYLFLDNVIVREDSILQKVYFWDSNKKVESVLYDFSVKVGDSVLTKNNFYAKVTNVDSVLIDNKFRKRIILDFIGLETWIVGIGNVSNRGVLNPLGPVLLCSCTNELRCFAENGNWIYHTDAYKNNTDTDDCEPIVVKKYKPILNVKNVWTNEFSNGEGVAKIYNVYRFIDKDTIIQNQKYLGLAASIDTLKPLDNKLKSAFYLRELNNLGKVFILDKLSNKEYLLYDFSLKQGDSVSVFGNNFYNGTNENLTKLFVSKVDSVQVGNEFRKRISFTNSYTPWIEGIGNSVATLLNPGGLMLTCPCNGYLICSGTVEDLNYHGLAYTNNNCLPQIQGIEDDNFESKSVSIAPNPVVGTSIIKLNNFYSGKQTLEIYNATGVKVKSYTIDNYNEFQINNNDFENGFYFYNIKDSSVSGKLVIE